jgi:luciferase family oxidoreductase group 1
MAALRLSVLDQIPVPAGTTGPQALANTLELARAADRLGYHRYWLAEHHGTTAIACPAPEIMIAAVAAATRHLRVGSGGVMLPHYSALKVAEQFALLAGLYPGRIDLGIGRAPGTDGHTALALQRDRRHAPPDDFPQQLVELLAYLEDRMPEGHPLRRLQDLPGKPPAMADRPQVWLLGSSPQSGQWASELGLPYAFADFISPTGTRIAEEYRSRFEPAPAGGLGLAQPETVVAGWAICAESEAEAERHAASFRMMIALLTTQGRFPAVPPPDEALAFLAQHGSPSHPLRPGRRLMLGTPDQVKTQIEDLAVQYGAAEVMLVNILYDHQARLKSYELIAKAFGLAPRA